MIDKLWKPERLKPIAAYALGVILSLGIVAWVMRLWEAKLTIPWGYEGDQLFTGFTVKSIMDNGWMLYNGFAGMPGGMEFYDFPSSNNLDFLIIKALVPVSANYAMTMNLFFLLTFPLATVAMMYVLRRFRLSWPAALVGGLLFTFIPFHFMRGEGHLFLASCFSVPLACMVILRVFEDPSPLFGYKKGEGVLKTGLSPKFLGSAAICVIAGSSFVYYPFFTAFFLVVAGVIACITHRSKWPAVNAAVLILITVAVILINTSPTIIYHLFNGNNPLVGVRNPMEAEVFGLKIIQLFLPVIGHRISFLATVTSLYDSHFPLVNENSTASLGIIGSLGFVFLVCWLFYRKAGGSDGLLARYSRELDALSILGLAAVLLATIGGFGTLFNIVVSSQLRCYNRISIFIAFFCILAVMIVIESLITRFAKNRMMRNLAFLCLALILAGGIFDQTSPLFAPPYQEIEKSVASDSNFVAGIEAIEPAGAMIFQLPCVGFPESPPVANMTDYDHFRAYLNSDDLRWSYGAMKGRESDLWQEAVASLAVPDMVRNLSLAGFAGIYVDSFGYNDSGRSLMDTLSSITGEQPLVSEDKRLYFFDMTSYNSKLRANYTDDEWSLINEMATHPVTASWKSGYYQPEVSWDQEGRWCSYAGELWISNPSDLDRNVTVEMSVSTGHSEPAHLDISGLAIDDHLIINSTPRALSWTITLKPGTGKISFRCDALPVAVPDNPRTFVFRTDDFHIMDNY